LLVEFHKLHSDIIGLRQDLGPATNGMWKIPKRLVLAVEKLWTWFEENDDILSRVSLKLARLNVPDVVGMLNKLHPSTE